MAHRVLIISDEHFLQLDDRNDHLHGNAEQLHQILSEDVLKLVVDKFDDLVDIFKGIGEPPQL